MAYHLGWYTVDVHRGAAVVVGVDVGTTATKAVAFDAAGRQRGSADARYPLLEPAPGRAEQDPGVVVDGALEAIRVAVAQARTNGASVAGLALSAAMHALIALDAEDHPLTRLITWADTRASTQAQRLRAEHPDLHDRTGTPIHSMAPLPKLVWFAENEPETFAAARRWVGVKELVVARLTGTYALDHSTASGTGLLNLETLDWDRGALAAAGIGSDRLAALVPATERLELRADVAAALGLDRDVPLVVGAGDGPSANLGVGAVAPGIAACSIGTSGALRLTTQRPAVDRARHLFCYALTPGRWIVGGAISNGGVVLQWAGAALAPDLGEHAEAQLIALAEDVPPGSDGLLMLPYLLGERAPLWSGSAPAAYVGLARHHGRGHLVRSALEGVCQQLRLVLDAIRDAGNEVTEVRATGGFARSALWRQMLADVLDAPIGFAASEEGSARGAAILGLQTLGLADRIDAAEPTELVEPNPRAAAVYAAQRPTFVALGQALAPYQPT
jgi:gluconokinase